MSRLFVSLRYLYKPPITTLSILLQPILEARKATKRWNSVQQNCDSSASSGNLQPNTVTSLPRDSDCRSLHSEEDHISNDSGCELLQRVYRPAGRLLCIKRAHLCAHPRRSDMTEPPLHGSSSWRNPCRSGLHACKRAQSSPRSAHLPPQKRTCCPQCLKKFFSSHQRQSQMSQNLWLRQFVADGTLSPCSRPSKAFANAAVGLFKWIAQKSNHTWDLVRIIFAKPATNQFLYLLRQSSPEYFGFSSLDFVLLTAWCSFVYW